MKIAIVGMGAVLPGCQTLHDFWTNVSEGKDLVQSIPKERLGKQDLVSNFDMKDRMFHDKGYVVPSFDLEMHGLNLEEALLPRLDPIFHYCLKAGRDAFFDSKWDAIDRSKTGVILGNIALPTEFSSKIAREILGETFFELVENRNGIGQSQDAANYFSTSLPALLLAKALGLSHEAFSLDAACASSLYAVKLACDQLESGEADTMLAGGMCRADKLFTQMGFTQLQALSPSGKSQPFDEDGDGLLVGEGGAIFTLKRLEDAVAHGDHIYGVIRGIGLSNDMDGKLMAPSSEGQLRAMDLAYRQASWKPSQVDFIECHATGTPVGDAIEIESYKELWGEQEGSCILSSVKGNIGHLLTGAGASGLARTLLAMEKKTLPPSANFNESPSRLNLDQSPFKILKKSQDWQRSGDSRKAAVSAFGFGGINAHVLVEEFHEGLLEEPNVHKDIKMAPVAVIGIGTRLSSQRDIFDTKSWKLKAKSKKRWFGVEESRWFNDGESEIPHRVKRNSSIEVPFGMLKIPPNEMKEMLPQQVYSMLASEEAIHDAGAPELSGSNCGIFWGCELDGETNNFSLRWDLEKKAKAWNHSQNLGLDEDDLDIWTEKLKDACWKPLTANGVMGSLASIIPSRIAREHKIGGPSFVVSGMENSGLHALKLAVQQIQKGELRHALVGATDMAGQVLQVLSKSRLCRPQGAEQDSMYEDGSVCLILKDYKSALKDGNKIYGVIDKIQGGVSGKGLNAWPSKGKFKSLAEKMTPEGSFLYRSENHWCRQTISDHKMIQNWEEKGKDCSTFPISFHKWHQGAATGLVRLLESMLIYQEAYRNSWQKESYFLSSHGAASGGTMFVTLRGDKEHSRPNHQMLPLDSTIKTFRVDIAGDPFEVPKAPRKVRPLEGASTSNLKENPETLNVLPSQRNFVEDLLQTMMEAEKANTKAQQAYENLSISALKLSRELHNREGAASLGLFSPTWAGLKGRESGATGTGAESIFPSSELQRTVDFPKISTDESLKDREINPKLPLESGDLHELARGSVTKVFGSSFNRVDQNPSRLRIPGGLLQIIEKVTLLDGKALSLGEGTIVAEQVITEDAWYLENAKLPMSIAFEGKQCLAVLAAWLGIDEKTLDQKGVQLLNADLRFQGRMPGPGTTIRYEGKVDRIYKRGHSWQISFSLNALVSGTPLFSITNGVIGAIDESAPVLESSSDAKKGRFTGGYLPIHSYKNKELSVEDIQKLKEGDFSALGLDRDIPKEMVTLPAGKISMIDSATGIETFGGDYNIGFISTEKALDKGSWFFDAFPKDESYLSESLMLEGCYQTLKLFLMQHGLLGERDKVVFEPKFDEVLKMQFQRKVKPGCKNLRFDLSIKELGFGPNLYVKAEAAVFADSKGIGILENLSMQLDGLDKNLVGQLWTDARSPAFSYDQIVEFSTGSPSKAFGEPYKVFDEGRKMARLPRHPFQFLTEVSKTNLKPFEMIPGGKARTRFTFEDIAWFFDAENNNSMPYSVLLEVGLQSCGWMAAYMGSALQSEKDLFFRNLQGQGEVHQIVSPSSGELSVLVENTGISKSAGMIIQDYTFKILDAKETVFSGKSSFGFFNEEALNSQEGLKGRQVPELSRRLPASESYSGDGLPKDPLLMLDYIEPVAWDQGVYGKGRVKAYKTVDPQEWFFQAHFFQDPVMPGSLGLEAMIQLAKFAMKKRWPQIKGFEVLMDQHSWVYRGQVRPHHDEIVIDLHFIKVQDEDLLVEFEAYLYVDDTPIYQGSNFRLKGI